MERDQAVREIERERERRGGGEEKSDRDSCAIVLDAVERRRGSEVRRGEERVRSALAFATGTRVKENK